MDYPWLEDLKKVYSVGGLLEVRLASNGGHVTWSRLTLHDVPFWGPQAMGNPFLNSNLKNKPKKLHFLDFEAVRGHI